MTPAKALRPSRLPAPRTRPLDRGTLRPNRSVPQFIVLAIGVKAAPLITPTPICCHFGGFVAAPGETRYHAPLAMSLWREGIAKI